VTPIALSPKACLILRIVFAWICQSFQTKLDAVSLLQAFCHLERNENATNMCYTTSLSGGVTRQQKITHAHKSPFYHYAQFPHPITITYRGKKYSQILFEQGGMFH
jgi:L-fucose mutarotase/ribose pyranase (RbsD/FucU family)